jgi:outer membrane immunogenic protein
MNLKKALLTKVAAVALLAISGGIASAADVPYVEPTPEWSWSGFYIGLHLGYGESVDVDGNWCPSECEHDFDGIEPNGAVGGVHAGYNWQMDSIVFGIEGDVSFPDWQDESENCGGDCTTTFDVDVDLLASLRGRLGFAFDQTMIYATGGVAYQEVDFEGHPGFAGNDGDLDGWGGVVGAGIEHAVGDNISLRVEGLYYFFDEDEDLDDFEEFNNEGDNDDKVEIGDAWVIRAGITWLIH